MDKASSKVIRHKKLQQQLQKTPFLTDEELANLFKVSVPTIRLDRLELGIREVRERIMAFAQKSYSKVKAFQNNNFFGELIDMNKGETAISIFETDESMAFDNTDIVKGHFIFSFAENLAEKLIGAQFFLISVANIKYKIPVHAGEKLVANAEVIRVKENNYTVWIKIKNKNAEVFRGKFIFDSFNNNSVQEDENENNS